MRKTVILKLDDNNVYTTGDDWVIDGFFFCAEVFAEFFDFGNAKVIELRIDAQKPRDKNYYELSSEDTGGLRRLVDSPEDQTENDSPWSYRFDKYLSDEFPNTKKVYLSVYF